MRKGFIKTLFTMMFMLISIFCFQLLGIVASSKTYTSPYASYTEQEILKTNNLGYNVIHNKIKAISTTNTCSNPIEGFPLVDSPQQINMLTVPSTGTIRIVNYTFPNSSGWTTQTLSKLVKNFELTNPGWTVLAGVNGDFYDIKGEDYALKYHTTGSAVSNGEVLRARETKSVGFTNNGTSESFIMADYASFTKYHILTIYDNNGNIIKTFDVDKINEEPSNNELAVYYSYKVNNETGSDSVNVTVPASNSYISENPLRCLPTSEPEIYAKGEITKTNTKLELRFGQFAIVTNNEEIKSYLNIGTTIRVQKDVTGELANCDQVIGVGSTLVENGDVCQNNSDGMRTERHPRTCIGVKEDGTLMFFVIDGRQENIGYNGMTEDEMGTMMAYYGCNYGVNVDGGGSSTFGIRDEFGNFVIQNSPSDKNERSVANVLLVTVPQVQIQKSNIKDTSITLSYNEPLKGIEIDNILVTINGITKQMDSNEYVFDGLEPETEYELSYTYDITYNGSTSNIQGSIYKFKTGKVGPSVEYAYYDINNNNNNINLSFKTTDINNLATFGCIDYTDDIIFLEEFGVSNLNLKLSNIEKFDFKIEIDYSTQSVPNNNAKIIKNFTWYPLTIDLTELSSKKIELIEQVIEETNLTINDFENKQDVIDKINLSKQKIAEIIAFDERIEPAIQIAISQLDEFYSSSINKYSQEKINIILEYIQNAKSSFEKVQVYEEIELILKSTLEQISMITTLEQETQILEEFKNEKINELIEYKNNKEFSKKNNKKADQIIDNATKKIKSLKTAEEVTKIYNDVLNHLNLLPTNSCKSNTIIIYSNILTIIVLVYIIIKKSK